MADRSDRVEGTVAVWNADRGFGFIEPAAGGRQIFAHIHAFPQDTETPRVGQVVSFEVEKTPEGKTRARYVRPAGVAKPPRYGRTTYSILSYLPVVAFIVLYALVRLLWHQSWWFLVVYVGTSILCFIIYAIDKSAAAQGRWRVSESALLLLGLFGGWPGALVAQQVLHHKTKKRSFQAAFAGSIVVNVLAFVLLASPVFTSLTKMTVVG